MKLETVQVTNFRSAEDSEEFSISPVTCFVGKNEAGKSAILLALAALHPHASTPAIFDKERDYPRRLLTQYKQKHPEKDAVAITTTWQLDEIELARIETAVGVKVLTSSVVKILRRYGQEIEVQTKLDLSSALEFLYLKFSLDDVERNSLASVRTTSELIVALKELTTPTAAHQKLQAYLAKYGNVTGQVNSLVTAMLPKFMYFSSYDRMEGAIQLEQTKQLIASGQITGDTYRGVRLFVEFLDYAGVSIEEITSVSTYETFNARLQAASNNITDQILEYWTQNPDLNVIVRVE